MHSACSSCVLKARKLLDILAARGAAKGASRGVHIRWETLQLCVVTNILGYTNTNNYDGQTDGQTDSFLIAIPSLHSMQRGNKTPFLHSYLPERAENSLFSA